jgi:peptide/nickel transport system ATP-binding protein
MTADVQPSPEYVPAPSLRPKEETPTSATQAAFGAGPAPPPQATVLDVRSLRTYFFTYDGVVKALDGVTFDIRRGETMGLVGETGCGKSVTAFSITRLIADPPGRIMDGTIRFKGANLLWEIDREATYKPIKNTGRVKVRRRFRRIRAAQERMLAVRGGGISMIFQEPTSAMNPVFSVSDQIGEALLLHRGDQIIAGLLKANVAPPGLDAAIERAVDAARKADRAALRTACAALGEAVGLPTIGTEAYYELQKSRGGSPPSAETVTRLLRRARLFALQRRFLQRELRVSALQRDLKDVYLNEMRTGVYERSRRRLIVARRNSYRWRTFYFSLPGLGRRIRHPLREELFWQSVRQLESVSIANPVQVASGFPHELSGGMLQRVMIAMALSAEPELLIADEPTTALDVTIQAQILDLMRNLKERVGTAILLITHDLGVIAEVADRVCVMYAGNIVEVGPVRDIYRNPLHPYTRGLLDSIPRMDDPSKRLEAIPGSVPNLITPPPGCRFHPRCPHAMPICKERRPPMTVEGAGHTVACYLYHGPVEQR